jgi:hypothetical protein
MHRKPDLSLLVDVFNHPHTLRSLGAWRDFGAQFLDQQMAAAPFVHLATAYADVCNLAYLPCSGRATPLCPLKPLEFMQQVTLRDFRTHCFARKDIVRRVHQMAALNVFLSPLHKQTVEGVLSIALEPTFLLKPMIDVNAFRNEGRPRDIDFLFVGVISEAKGIIEMRERFKHADLHLIGQLAPGTTLDFGRHVGQVPYQEIPRWMNRAKNFVFVPRWPEPQGRVVAEAALCGCNIIANRNVGALSFGFDLADRTQYGGTEKEFWQTLEGLR